MGFSKSCEYAIRSLIFLAEDPSAGFVRIRHIADHLSISFSFLSKILGQLSERGLLRSSLGAAGGVQLARPPSKIFLSDIYECLEVKGFFERCGLGLEGCHDKNPCPIHNDWKIVRGQFEKLLRGHNIADLRDKMKLGTGTLRLV